jgi:hypothetical protein
MKLNTVEREQLRAVCKAPVWDGDLIMSHVAKSLQEKGLVFRSNGYTYPLPLGYEVNEEKESRP